MLRTQISLTSEQHRRLHEESRRTGRSVSALIRQAIDEIYRRSSAEDVAGTLAAIDDAFGAWSDRRRRLRRAGAQR